MAPRRGFVRSLVVVAKGGNGASFTHQNRNSNVPQHLQDGRQQGSQQMGTPVSTSWAVPVVTRTRSDSWERALEPKAPTAHNTTNRNHPLRNMSHSLRRSSRALLIGAKGLGGT